MTALKKILIVLLMLIPAPAVLAHALFIKTAAKATAGLEHRVQIFYAEPDGSELEPTAKWYSDVASFHLYLIMPDGRRSRLQTNAFEDHYAAAFIPETEGIYRLEISHTADKPGDGTAYQFNAFAQVQVGNSKQTGPLTEGSKQLALLENFTTAERGHFTVYLNGKPEGGIKTTVYFEDGNQKTFTTDAQGNLTFPMETSGRYTLEATIYAEGENGSTTNYEYKNIWRCATQIIEIP